MSRPREGDGIKRTIRRRGDRFYAYEVTSMMENGKKVTVSKYLGRVNSDTNELMGKNPEKSTGVSQKIAEQGDIKILEDMVIGDYGGCTSWMTYRRDASRGGPQREFQRYIQGHYHNSDILDPMQWRVGCVRGYYAPYMDEGILRHRRNVGFRSLSGITKEVDTKAEFNI